MSLRSSSPLPDPVLLRGLQVCNVLESEGYSWDSNLPSRLCCVMGHSREVRLSTTEAIASACPLLNESLRLSPCCVRVFAEGQEILRCMHCNTLDHQI